MQSSSQEIADLHIVVASTFTAEPVEKPLTFWLDKLGIPHTISFSPYNQVFQQLLDPNSQFSQNKRTATQEALNVIYLRLEDWLDGIDSNQSKAPPNGSNGHTGNHGQNGNGSHIEFTSSDHPLYRLKQNAEDLIKAIKVASLKDQAQHLLVLCPASEKMKQNTSVSSSIEQTEQFILDQLGSVDQVDVITQRQIFDVYPISGYDDTHTARAGHVPYTDAGYTALATITARRHSIQTRPPYKVIVLDCDNTLWRGVCAEDGPTGVTISPAFKALQQFMLAQKDAGMLLCLASKNIQADVEAVFDQNKDMLLSKEDIVSARVNWQPKSENIKSLAAELSLGIDSFIFIDDNPVECAEVRTNCPSATTFQLPIDEEDIARFLKHIWIFDKQNITDEDKKRAERYAQNVRREQSRTTSNTLKDFLVSLEINTEISSADKQHFPRVAQLTQRTNQFNATTIRRSEAEISRLIADGQLKAAVVHVSDKFGDYGLVGLLLYTLTEAALQVDTFILSCRALGRGVEQSMARFLAEEAQAANVASVVIAFSETARNKPVYAFLESVASHQKTSVDQGTIYTYQTADLLKIQPLEAATPSIATNGKEKVSKEPPANAGTQIKSADFWEVVASTLFDPTQITTSILTQTKPRPTLQTPFVEPQSEEEKAVAKIWQDVLGKHGIGLEDGFKELGGTSLQLVQIYGRLRAKFDIDLPFTTLFGLPTIRAFIEFMGATPDKEDQALAIQQRAARQKAALQKRKKLQLNLK